MNHNHFLLQSVSVVGPRRLVLTFADGLVFDVDLSEVIQRHPALSPLQDPSVFTQVATDEWQRGVVFAGNDNLTLASDNLRALAIEQSGEFSHQQLLTWMDHHGMTLDAAASALDVSRRMLAYYRSGAKPIPRTVGLAMMGWDIYALKGSSRAFEYEAAA